MTSSSPQTSTFKDFANRFMHSLQGKPLPPDDHTPVYPIEKIVSDLVCIPQEDWWKYAFSREPMNGRFKDEERLELYARAADCGRQTAREMIEKYGNITPEELAEKFGLDVIYRTRPQNSVRILFADFKEPKTIRIYLDGLEKGEEIQQMPQVAEAFGSEFSLASILMAHELYHVIELNNPDIWSRSHKIQLWKIGFLANHSPVAVLSEIAAMAFAEELNHLSFSAYLLDAFLVYGYSPKASSALYLEMMESSRAACAYAGSLQMAGAKA